jgi:hypothetical protein
MFQRTFIALIVATWINHLSATTSFGQVYERTGWEAPLSTLFHGVSGTLRIVDQNTLEVINFHYDGGGPTVYFYLGQDDTYFSFREGLLVGPLLTGQVYEGDSFIIDLPPGHTLDPYTAVSVWCADYEVNFGSGSFGSVMDYKVVFDATWSGETHQHFPPGPHFSGLIGGTHNAQTTFWDLGGQASAGIEAMAELGAKSPLSSEINSAIQKGTAYSLISDGGINPSPSTVSTVFTMHSAHPLVSLVSMIAPSPDWFVGVSGLPLYQEGHWLSEVTVDLYPYDAGTDSGPNFISANQDTQPQDPITEISGFPFENDPPLGTFTFRLLCDNPPIGDINGDCRVDYEDFALMASNWLLDCSQTPGQPNCQ